MIAIEEQSVPSSAPPEQAGTETDPASLLHRYGRLLFRVAHSVVRSPTDAEEIVQDVFVRVLEHRHTLATVRDMRVWLVRIAWNLAIDRKRRTRPEQIDAQFVDTLVASGTPADQAIDDRQRMHAVLREIDRLPKPERHALQLAAIDDLGISEMAHILGRSESAVRALLFRARTRLRDRLNHGGSR